MTFRDLGSKEMIQLSSPVVTEGTRQHEALMSVPAAGASLPVLQAAHDGLVVAMSGDDSEVMAERVRALAAEHDVLVGQIGLRLDAEIAAARTEEEASQLRHARDLIIPPGSSVIRQSMAAKAGEHAVRERRVTREAIAMLGTIPLRGGGTLADTYAALQRKTLQLSQDDAERQRMLAESAGPKVREARKRWVAAVELIDMAMTAVGADATPVLGAIRAAQARVASGHASEDDVGDEPTLPAEPVVTGTSNGTPAPGASTTTTSNGGIAAPVVTPTENAA